MCAPLACSKVHIRESMRSTSLLQGEMMNDDAKVHVVKIEDPCVDRSERRPQVRSTTPTLTLRV